jgi:hypothetical protein
MSAAVDIEGLLAREGEFHRPSGDHRQLGRADLMREWIALTAEAAADRGCDHPDAAGRKLEHFGQSAMQIVRRLGRGPKRELVVRAVKTDRAVLLHRQMSIALIKKGSLENMVRAGEATFDVAEFEGHGLLHVSAPVPGVDALTLFGGRQRLFDGENRFQNFVFNVDKAERLFRQAFADRRHRRHGIAGITDLIDRQRLFVLGRGHDAELLRQVLAGEHGEHAIELERPRGVDAEDARMGMGAAQELGVNHPRQIKIVRVHRLAGALRHGVDFAQRLADYR